MIEVIIQGNIGQDAQSRQVGDRYAVSFSVASTEKYTDKNGEKKETTTWLRCTYWTKNAAYASYLTKGQSVIVIGDKLSTFVGNNGTASLELTASKVQLCGGKPSAQPTQQAPAPQTANATPAEDDDLPPFLR